jgi:hypothetical protein
MLSYVTAALLHALSLWGWSGMHLEVRLEPVLGAIATPQPLGRCTVVVDPGIIGTEYERMVLLHEAGHCAGYVAWGSPPSDPRHHSTNPLSVMSGALNGQILDEDCVFARQTLETWLRFSGPVHKIAVPLVAR